MSRKRRASPSTPRLEPPEFGAGAKGQTAEWPAEARAAAGQTRPTRMEAPNFGNRAKRGGGTGRAFRLLTFILHEHALNAVKANAR